MKTRKSKENQNQSDINSIAKKKNSNVSLVQFVDNRQEHKAQGQLQEMASNYTSKQTLPIQRVKEPYKNQPLITNYFGKKTNKTSPNDSKQPLITNYFGQKTNQTFEKSNYPYHFNDEDVKIKGSDNDFSASIKGLGDVGELELYQDEKDRRWINQIHVEDRAKRRGIGAALLAKAIELHKVLYASIQSAEEDKGDDTRHLTDEGELLVNGCIKKGMNIIKGHPDF